jgi:lipopolysaccharide transport system ATP-binding protein
MQDDTWEIAICGTFDVQNYGDLLFPIIAEAELRKRLGQVMLHALSYHAKSPPDWPYPVTPVAQLPRLAMRLDGVLIGGGFIIRFDKDVAPGYYPPDPQVHHPTGYWLTPALIALQHGIPLIWNAPGMHCNLIPEWAEPLVRLALQGSSHIRVRDKPSQETLRSFCDDSPIEVLPDTAFGISRMLDRSRPSAELEALRGLSGLAGPYIIVHAIHCVSPFIRFMQNHRESFHGIRFLILPIGPVLGDDETVIGDALPNSVKLPFWPHPLLLAELISHAEAVVGHSYHLAITALACGVPVFSSADLSTGKYTALAGFEAIYPLPGENEDDLRLFLGRIGRRHPSAAMQRVLGQLDEHWDRVAEIIKEGRTGMQPMLGRLLQSLPNILEIMPEQAAAEQAAWERSALERFASEQDAREYAEKCAMEYAAMQRRRIDELENRLALANAEIAALHNSRSFRITAPLRHISRRLRIHKNMEG